MKKIIDISNCNAFNIDWIPNINAGIIIENPSLGVRVLHYAIYDNSGKFKYDTIAISEKKGGCIVVITNQNKQIGLIREYRPIPDKNFLSCVRGYNEQDIDVFENAKKEVYEETGISNVLNINKLGIVYPNTAYFVNPIEVFHAVVDSTNGSDSHKRCREEEGISEFAFYSRTDVLDKIKNRNIECQMSLSALMLHFSNNFFTNDQTH